MNYKILLSALLIISSLTFTSCKVNNSSDSNKEETNQSDEENDEETNEESAEEMKEIIEEFIEEERPEVNEDTKIALKAYRENPSEENLANLKKIIEKNYDAVVAKKEAKLQELKDVAKGEKGEELVQEMEEIIEEMYETKDYSIEQTLLRLIDKRNYPSYKQPYNNFVSLLGCDNLYIGYTPVTNKEYQEFIDETSYTSPSHWVNNHYLNGEEDYPVVNVSYYDALEYCSFLNKKENTSSYRLPSEYEWEMAAGHMPKDVKMNCTGVNGEISTSLCSVYEYQETSIGACGMIDCYGNAWEWTSTEINKLNEIKGGCFSSSRDEARMENRKSFADPSIKQDTIGFRIIKDIIYLKRAELNRLFSLRFYLNFLL